MKNWVLAAGLCLACASVATADEVVFTVGGDKDKGKEAATGGGKWSKSLSKGFKAVSEHVNAGGEMTVVLKVAAGDYDGDLGSGAYELPSFRNEQATLRFEGGYSEDFGSRDPFHTPSKIVTVKERSLPLWQFYNSRNFNVDQDVVQAYTIDGFLFDTQNSNNYDPQANTLLLGRGTSTWPMMRFSNFRMDLLEVKNCVFINSPHRVFETLVRPLTMQSRVRIFNNLFINCLMPVKLTYALTRDSQVASFEVDHNSFLLCWGANADVNTGNPCPLEWDSAAKSVTVTNNLFYANFGGGINALTPTKLTINNNDFAGNGLLHGKPELDAVAMVVEAGGKKQTIDVDTIEELDFVEEAEDNVSIDPGINLAFEEVTPVNADDVKPTDDWDNRLRRLLGENVDGGTVKIKNFAPKKQYDPANPPFPTNPAAQRYGASPELVGQ